MSYNVLMIVLASVTICSGQDSANTISKFPGPDVCGISKMKIARIIIGGEPAQPGDYPWMANIRYRRTSPIGRSSFACGGSLITDQHVVTAAHCLNPETLKRKIGMVREVWEVASVRIGDLDLNLNVTDGATPADYGVEEIIYHPQYDNNIKANDIGIIKLKTKVKFTDLVRPICLPPAELDTKTFVDEMPTIAGWGNHLVNMSGAQRDTRLLRTNVQVKTLEECKRNITSVPEFKNNAIDNKVICAGSPLKDACQGDSGGPLMYLHKESNAPEDSNGNWYIIGIVSYGWGCAKEGYPAVYARVSEYKDWLQDNVKF